MKWEMEISFISEVGKKNVPETSSITNLEGKCALRQQYTARSEDSAHKEIVPLCLWEQTTMGLS